MNLEQLSLIKIKIDYKSNKFILDSSLCAMQIYFISFIERN